MGCLSLIVVASAYGPLRADAALRDKLFRSIDEYPGVRIGRVLASRYGPDVRILYSTYSYIPPAFTNAKMQEWNMTIAEMRSYDPDVIVLRLSVVEFWRTVPGEYSAYAQGYVKEPLQYYEGLVAGELGYHRVASEGEGTAQFILFERDK